MLVIAASVADATPDDQFKVSKLDVCAERVKFYTVDATQKDAYEYSPSGQSLANYDLHSANTNPRGVTTTAVGDKLWVVDGNKIVYVYDADGKSLGSWTANGLTTPEDVATNGTDVWIVDDGSNKVFKYAGGSGAGANRLSGSQNASFSFNLNSANANPKGIVTDGTFLWVVNDTTTDTVFKYKASDGSLVGSWTIDSQNGSPTGITLDPADVNHLWIVDRADRAVYRYNAATGRNTGSQTATYAFQLAASNSNVQGIADPPPAGGQAQAGNLATETVRSSATLNGQFFAGGSTTVRAPTTPARLLTDLRGALPQSNEAIRVAAHQRRTGESAFAYAPARRFTYEVRSESVRAALRLPARAQLADAVFDDASLDGFAAAQERDLPWVDAAEFSGRIASASDVALATFA